MTVTKKTDNSHLAAKLGLRRYFLDRYHAGERIRVIDCCAGESVIWTTLRREYEVDYWGIDKERKRGRMHLDSIRVLQQPGWRADVVDIDTYGSPWGHWMALLENATQPLTVFLTYGQISP